MKKASVFVSGDAEAKEEDAYSSLLEMLVVSDYIPRGEYDLRESLVRGPPPASRSGRCYESAACKSGPKP